VVKQPGEEKKTKKSNKGKAAADALEQELQQVDEEEGLDMDFTKKKKKKKASKAGKKDSSATGSTEDGDGTSTAEDPEGAPWLNTTRPYHYEELLSRFFTILREKNPALAGEKSKIILKPPKVMREGTKKTVFENLNEICESINRDPQHVVSYLLAELGTNGSIDGQNRLVIKGRFLPKVFEGVLRHYINEYVLCTMCKSTDTTLLREGRLFILRCNSCSASRSVSAIKSGFQAQIGRRKR
jgi:translation initiation factor 2 subunit 2